LLWRGALAGLAISIPVGPVNVLCASRAIEKGFRAGVVAGLGAAVSDTVYGAVAGFSISFVIAFLVREIYWIRLFGGLLLIGIGAVYLMKKPRVPERSQNCGSTHTDFGAAFLLNLTNPTTVLSFLAVLAALQMDGSRPWWQTLFLVAGIFAGAMLWWTTLAAVASHFRDRFTERAALWMNRAAGAAIGAFGVLTLILSRMG